MNDPKRLNTFAAIGCMLFLLAAYGGLKAFAGPWAIQDMRHTIVSDIMMLVAMAGLMTACLWITSSTWADLGLTFSLTRREVVWGVAAGFAVSGAIACFHSLKDASPRQAEEALTVLFNSPQQSWVQAFLGIGLITGMLEELVYRGAIVGFLRRGFGGGTAAAGLAAFVSGLVFSLTHPLTGLDAYVLYGAIGVGLSLVYMHTGSLSAVMLAHVIANFIGVARALVGE